jgi:hypothetical protein
MRKLAALFFAVFILISISRDQAAIKGKVTDSAEKKILPNR